MIEQGKRVREALRQQGVRFEDMRVRTERTVKRDGSGFRYVEYGDAQGSIMRSGTYLKMYPEILQNLANQNLSVYALRSGGRVTHWWVYSTWNPSKEIIYVDVTPESEKATI